MIRPQTLLTACTAAALVVASGAAIGLGPDTSTDSVAREGSGSHREASNALELKPFALDLDALASWSNEQPITADQLVGKPVLIVTWSSLSPSSNSALRLAQKAQDQFAKDGLVVIGVHHEKGFARAEAVAKRNRINFPFAHDELGTVRASLNVDQDPDFYMIDRAGNMRVADIDSGSVLVAAELLTKETAEAAEAIPGNIANSAKEQASSKRLTGVLDAEDALTKGDMPEVEFTMPDAETFESIKWPAHNKNQLSAKNVQGKQPPIPLERSDVEYLTDAPTLRGRVVVVDFWATWCGPCIRAMPLLDALQRRDKRDLVIVGISNEDEHTVRRFMDRTTFHFTKAIGLNMYGSLEVRGIPHTMILSSDGVVRWQGNPHNEDFVAALDTVLKRDPGVKARKAAEDQFKKQNQTIKTD